jgi:hypothetical protein
MKVREGGPRGEILLVVGDRQVAIGRIAGTSECDLELVDRLVRLQLAAMRIGFTIRLEQVDRDLRELVELVGLGERLGI